MEQKINPLTSSYPEIDKILSLVRKAMIVNQTMSVSISVSANCFRDETSFDFYFYKDKASRESVFSPSISTRDGDFPFTDHFKELNFILNHLLTKGSFPKNVPEYDSFDKLLTKTKKLINK